MTTTPGSNGGVNRLKMIASAMVTTKAELENFNEPFALGSLIYTSDNGRLVIGDGVTSAAGLPDHKHSAYAPVIHSHTYINNDAWLPSSPKLWYTDDLVNHPELIALDGSEIPQSDAVILSQYYPGSSCITNPCTSFTINGDSNDQMTVVASSWDNTCMPGRMFGEPLEIDDIAKTTDQWLTGTNTGSSTVTIIFANNTSYVPTEYWIIPAAGTLDAVVKERPTPNTWALEGSNDGNTWTVLDSRSSITDVWAPLQVSKFEISDNTTAYNQLRLTITTWNSVDDASLLGGIRRLWIFGHKSGVFLLPKLESPSEEFTWVVPYTSSNQGLKHEDVGDIGITSCLPENLSSYRLPADGRAVVKSSYDLLFASIGYTNDHVTTITSESASDGTITSGNLVATISDSDVNDAVYVEVDNNGGGCLGAYSITPASGSNTPMTWLVEGYNTSTAAYETITSITSLAESDFNATDGYKFYIPTSVTDTVYSKFRITITVWHQVNATVNLTFAFYTHPSGSFYLPNVEITGVDGCYCYIVANNTAQDVSSTVISNLQADVADLTETISALTNRIENLEGA